MNSLVNFGSIKSSVLRAASTIKSNMMSSVCSLPAFIFHTFLRDTLAHAASAPGKEQIQLSEELVDANRADIVKHLQGGAANGEQVG
jgi:hypothetical protein